ncbi:TetR/AcrR family transcriptional regulator [Dokdonella sp.]|uniref:TetR/AcrR family transcriptional regulator n=1 Tax=Dokdonella sp. TaxID=2291710 RepID=UPI0035282662
MRYDKDHKRETRTRVLDAAARSIRESGPDRVGVASVMASAGLTHGGFYAHFDSRDDLVAAAIAHMFTLSGTRLRSELENGSPAQGLQNFIDYYLSRRHRDERSSGCPIAALSSDLPRLGRVSRVEFSRGVDHLAGTVAEMIAALGQADADSLARSIIAELVGALSLARVEPKPEKSDAILVASRKLIKARLGLEAHA